MKEERAEFEMIVNLVLGRAHTLVFLVIKAKTAFLCVFVICQVSIVVWSRACRAKGSIRLHRTI